ncbi:MAG: RING finger family 4 domain-containing protein, partial [Candidatus Sericytochromatia bacterium]
MSLPQTAALPNARRVLLLRQGLVFAAPQTHRLPDRLLEAVELQLADLGYAVSARLRDRLATLSVAELTEVQLWVGEAIAASLGANHRHVPLFRRFPDDVPTDTHALWMRKVLSHFLQAEDQPCLFCRRTGTTHVLSCLHVVCDHCFDGTTYSACPVCERHVDRSSPFFQPSGVDRQTPPNERVRFKLLDLGDDLDAQAGAYIRALVDRRQPLSPSDADDLKALVVDFGDRVLGWLPTPIPVRETMATVLAAVIQSGGTLPLATAEAHLRTATDVLRFIAAHSGAEPSLQGEPQKALVPPNGVQVRT